MRFMVALSRWAWRESDSVAAREAKVLLAPGMLTMLTFSVLVMVLVVASGGGISWGEIGYLLSGGVCIVGVARMLLSDVDVRKLAGVVALGVCCGMMFADIGAAQEITPRVWPVCTVAATTLRLLRADSWATWGCLLLAVVALAVVGADQSGAYRFPALQPRKARLCDCDDPPCVIGAVSASISFVGSTLILLLIDLLSQQFAENVSKQLDLVKASVLVTGAVTASLSKYEVEDAELVVLGPGGDSLPSDLRESLAVLVHNLKVYKPYLPQSCLMVDAEEVTSESSTAPSVAGSCLSSRAASVALEPASGSSSHGESFRERRRQSERAEPGRRTSEPVRAPARRRGLTLMKMEPAKKPLTLLCTNTVGFTDYLSAAEAAEVTRRLAAYVRVFGDAVGAWLGVVDLVSGDHLFASFNASRQCSRHAHRALMARSAFDRDADAACVATHAVVSSTAVCGLYGSETVQRFMILGRVTNLLAALDRLAVRWGVHVLANENNYADTYLHWQCALVGACVLLKGQPHKLVRLYEPKQVVEERGGEEWMYEIATLEGPTDRGLAQVSQWIDELEQRCAEGAEQSLNEHFGCSRVVAVADVGVQDYREWARRRQAPTTEELEVVDICI